MDRRGTGHARTPARPRQPDPGRGQPTDAGRVLQWHRQRRTALAPHRQLAGLYSHRMVRGPLRVPGHPDTRHYNPLGSVHGGYAATLLDSCMGCAIHTRLKKGLGYTTLDLRVSYVRALTDKIGPIRAEGKVIHVGRSTALAEGRIYDVDDRLYAVATTTCMILDMNR